MIARIAPSARVVLLDIEGTTTPISFVHDTLFSYAREHLESFLRAHWESADVRRIVAMLEREHAERDRDGFSWSTVPGADLPAQTFILGYVRWLMDRDRKSPGLKELQGLIWDDGYRAGLLHGAVWEDVPRAIARWRAAGLRVAIYSSGSELAQRRLFASTPYGDLTPNFDAFFDTRMGGKLDAGSYGRISEALDVEPRNVCFVSDVTGELKAARAAGCATILSARPGNPPQAEAGDFAQVTTFDEL